MKPEFPVSHLEYDKLCSKIEMFFDQNIEHIAVIGYGNMRLIPKVFDIIEDMEKYDSRRKFTATFGITLHLTYNPELWRRRYVITVNKQSSLGTFYKMLTEYFSGYSLKDGECDLDFIKARLDDGITVESPWLLDLAEPVGGYGYQTYVVCNDKIAAEQVNPNPNGEYDKFDR
jgi:hypothetical protein